MMPIMAIWLLNLLLASPVLALQSLKNGINNHTLSNVRTRLSEIANASWELGAAAQALTEFAWPQLSVFEETAFPPPARLNSSWNASDVLNIAVETVRAKPQDSLPLIPSQGSAADPASLGVAVLLANWTLANSSTKDFADAAKGQLEYLLWVAPRSADNAISHRADEAQLWSDFVYMVPPFIAYYGALQGGQYGRSLMQTAYDQCYLYREHLRDDTGLWRHVVLGSWEDDTHWATGNGWAAAGMLRVLQTLNHSSDARHFTEHQTNLTKWISEITTAAWSHQQSNGTLLNVLDDPHAFADSASTALLASVTYRMAAFNNDTTLIASADKALALINDSIDASGWLQNTVNPYTFHEPNQPGKHSPEGQAFVLLLHAAWRQFNSTKVTSLYRPH